MNVLVVGGGQVGAHLAGMLLSGGQHVTLIETRAEQIERLAARLPGAQLVHGSGSDLDVLAKTCPQWADVVAAVTGADEVNLVVTSLARSAFGVERTIARVNDPRNAWLFTPAMGVDVALSQADLMAHLIAEEMSLGEMITLLKLRQGQYALVEAQVHPASRAAGLSLRELDLPPDCVLVVLLREGELIIPRGEVCLMPHDEVLALVHSAQEARLAALLAPG